jgi:molybdate transport system substrate-binding protein
MTSAHRPARWVAAVVVTAVAVTGCGRGEPEATTAPSPVADGGEIEGELTVFAAASLVDVFTELAGVLEARHPGVTVRLELGASSSLREQVLAGAPADVFAAADERNVAAVVGAGEASSPVRFATNELQIAVPAGNPAGVDGLADLADEDLLVGLCAVEVPCGSLAREAFDRAGLTPRPDTEEPDVRALLAKVRSGDLDAGVVYRTDVRASAPAVEGIDLPDDVAVETSYPLVVLDRTGERDVADAFVALVTSEEGRAVLAAAGFGHP